MADEEEVYLLCMPFGTGHYMESLTKACHKCGRSISVTPASLAAAGSKAKLTCPDCLPHDEKQVQEVSDGQLRELSRHLGREVSREEVKRLLRERLGI